jgi:hypothetical protein
MNSEEEGLRDPSLSGTARWNASALFWGSVASLLFFHFLPVFSGTMKGWTLWAEVARRLLDPKLVRDSRDLVFIASLLTLVVLVTASPFLVGAYLKSRLAWGLAAMMSGLATAVIWYLVLQMDKSRGIDPGGWCLLAAPALNFAGLIALRSGGVYRHHP